MVSRNVFIVVLTVVLCFGNLQCQLLQRPDQDQLKLTDDQLKKLTEDIQKLPKQKSSPIQKVIDWYNRQRPNRPSVRPNFDNGLGAEIKIKKDNFEFKAHGSVIPMSKKKPLAGVSATWRFKKRGIPLPKEYFELRIEANPCQFNVYDRDGDGMITLGDLYKLFSNPRLAERLFLDLKAGLEDDVDAFDEDDFNFMAPKLILGCQPLPLEESNSVEEPEE